MTTLSIHTDDIFADALRAYAQASGKSVNQTVKDLLAPILGLDHAPESDQTNPYMKLRGNSTDKPADRLLLETNARLHFAR